MKPVKVPIKSYKMIMNRLYSNEEETVGAMYFRNLEQGGKFQYVWTLEDEYREEKVFGETRIPAGLYKIEFRKEGGFYKRYCRHRDLRLRALVQEFGIPILKDVEGFTSILIHPGNKDEDTEGCILVGMSANNFSMHNEGIISDATVAFRELMYCLTDASKVYEELLLYINDVDRSIEKLLSPLKRKEEN